MTRYARSDNYSQQASRSRQSISHRFYQEPSDSVFVGSTPTSPAGYLPLQTHYSRSMNNLQEKENFHIQPSPMGQVKSVAPLQLLSNRGQTMRSKWNQGTYRTTVTTRDSFQSSAGATGLDVGGKKVQMGAGNTAVGGASTTQVQQLGNVQPMSDVEMTLETAVSLLQNENSTAQWLAAAESFIQHECYQKAEARRQVYNLGGIPKLIKLLKYDNEEVQRAGCAALRNLVYEDNDNKLEVCEQRVIPVLINLLKGTQDLETKRQITGLLWNLSSNDQLKSVLIREVLQPLTWNIVIPGSGWNDGEYSKSPVLTDQDIFYNATGCLRNMSSAGPEGRRAMRDCEGLVDSLVHYSRRSVADYNPNDKATENCVCILHNLSYQLETELPSSYTQFIFQPHRDAPENNDPIGCFGTRSRKIKENWGDTLITDEKNNPRGVEWLWHSIVVRMYLSLIAKSTLNYTQEASLGALQNLTAGNGPMPSTIAQLVVQRERGLQYIRNMLDSSDPGVKRTTVSFLRNLSRYPKLQNEIAKELLPELVKNLPGSVPESGIATETSASICYVVNNLIANSSENARMVLTNGGVPKLTNLSASDSNLATKLGKAASFVLYTMWTHQDLHSTYKKSMFKKADFVNPRTTKAYDSLKD
ncbi:hypothetical protein GDO86_004952 [Hymenochirus boettgeri]|uniref:Plakophilin-2 n=1 Tax=Hymenochirus boettgeri TaxID=247094 RepID=A0A8T2J2R6_9PIPI|nr:hypothetical protein GDO86_004952 [Hymenochirus boettgeri]